MTQDFKTDTMSILMEEYTYSGSMFGINFQSYGKVLN